MSRRRGEFEHRTSIFEGAFRAWSHLGGLEPEDLEGKSPNELDPLTNPHLNDPRLAEGGGKKAGGGGSGNSSPVPEGGDNGGGGGGSRRDREYPYEPLPRTGLSHPFVQAILSPWLGPDADQDAIQLGLTTLRTWWQHRRKGESGTAVAALGTEKMRGVVEGYTRHFFNLAHCLVVNDNEPAPRTLMQKMKKIEKTRSKKIKKRTRDEEADRLAAMAMSAAGAQGVAGLGADGLTLGGMGGVGMDGMGGRIGDFDGSYTGDFGASASSGLDFGASSSSTAAAAAAAGGCCDDGLNPNLTPLERLHAEQQRQLGTEIDPATGLPKIDVRGKCIPGKLDLPGIVNQVSSNASQLAHRGALASASAATPGAVQSNPGTSTVAAAHAAAQAGQYGDPTKTPVVFVSENGDIQIAMSVDGITCAHCVKIVETVLKGCNGNKSPIDGLLDAAADRALNSVLIKIDRSSSAKRIAFESARNLAMVGYTAIAKEMDIGGGANGGQGLDLGALSKAFDVVATTEKSDVFDWTLPCTCPDNGVLREDCSRHSQMNRGIFAAFDRRQEQVQRFVSGCNSQHGMPCSCGPDCRCANCDKSCQQNREATAAAAMAGGAVDSQTMLQQIQEQRMALDHQQQALANGSASNGAHGGSGGDGLPPGISPQDLAQLMEGGGAPTSPGQRGSVKGHGRTSVAMSIASEETFGRAMSGLSALSIDWENMDDFDINVDHSAYINSDVATGGVPPVGVIIGDAASGGVDNGIMQGCGMATGGACTCGPSCVCVGCPAHDQATALPNFTTGSGGPRHSSMRKGSQVSSPPAAAPGGDQAAEFKI